MTLPSAPELAELRRLCQGANETVMINQGGLSSLLDAYELLYNRFEQVMTISDKYRENIATHVSQPMERQSNTLSVGQSYLDGELIAALRGREDQLIQRLLLRYEKLESRFMKIISISDSYQEELRQATAKMEHMARTDPLTGLANRRDMIERMEIELARSERLRTKFSIIMFDIDNFKLVNDQFGHDRGDEVLVGVAKTCVDILRRADLCARWGGEEFLILCPDTGLDDAVVVAEKCRQALSTMGQYGTGQYHPITISAGVSVFTQGDVSWSTMVTRADNALYKAKNAGKNSVLTQDD